MRVLAGEPQPEVVLGQQHVSDPAPHLGLVLAHPDELWRGEAGQRVVAGDRDQPLGSDGGPDQVALRGRALVVPQDRRPQNLVVLRRARRGRASGRSGRRPRHQLPDTPPQPSADANGVDAPVHHRLRVLLAPHRPRHARSRTRRRRCRRRRPSRRSGRPWSRSSRRRCRGRAPAQPQSLSGPRPRCAG